MSQLPNSSVELPHHSEDLRLFPEAEHTTCERWLAGIFIAAAIALNVWAFYPMLKDEALYHSDFGFHLSVLRSLDETIMQGGNPLDFWYDTSPFGFALFRSYQNLPYLIIYSLYTATFHTVSLDGWLRLTTLFLAALFPLSLYWTARRLHFSFFEAGVAAMLGALISEAQNFGLGLQNYTFGTGGMVTQLWAVVALGPAIALGVQFLRTGVGLAPALLWAFVCFGSHVVSAAILLIALGTYSFTLITLRSSVRRCVLFFSLLALLTSYQWIFIISDGRYINKSTVEPDYKYASHGIQWVVHQILDSGLFDAHRVPSLTILLVFGLICGIADLVVLHNHRLREISKILGWLLFSFLLSLTLLAGWEIWGPLFSTTPVLRSLHMHRFIIMVNLFGVLLAAYGCGVLRTLLPNRPALLLSFTIVLYAILHPAWVERIARHSQAETWRATASEAWQKDKDLHEVIKTIQSHPRTYVHPGNHQTWTDTLRLARMVPLHDILIAQGIPTMGGMLFHAFSLAGDTMFNFSATRESTYKLFGVGLVLAPRELSLPSFLSPVINTGRYSLYRSRATRLSMIRLGFNVRGARDAEPHFMQRWVASPLLEQNFYGVIDGDQPDLPTIDFSDELPLPNASLPSAVATISEGPWTQAGISADIQSKTGGYILFKTGFHPNWSATVDGTATRTVWVTPGFIAAEVPPGKHSLSFSYRGSWVKILLFLLALFGLGTLCTNRGGKLLRYLRNRASETSL